MANKINTDKHLVQAYASPHTQEFFGMDKKQEFEKHLRFHARTKSAAIKVEKAKNERLHLWATLRQTATCLNDVPILLNNLPSTLSEYYRDETFYKSDNHTGWPLTFKNEPTIALQSITKASPLKRKKNWRNDVSQPGNLLGIRGDTHGNINYKFANASRESGIVTNGSTYVLFAEDWPFVAKMALRATFEKTIEVPSKHFYNSNVIQLDYTQFWDDINAYSIAHVGIPYAELTEMGDALGLSGVDLDAMMQTYDNKISPAGDCTMALKLPDGIDDDSSFSPSP